MQRTIWLATALFTLLPAAAAWADAQIVIHTEPADAQVYVDGILKGDHTPLHVPSLAAGKHTVEVKKSGLVGELRNFEIGDGTTMPLEFKLVPEQAGSPAPKECDTCPEMVNIPTGEFWMGAADDGSKYGDDAKPRHKVQIAAFKLGRYEVTVGQFAAFVKESGYSTERKCFARESPGDDYDWRDPGFPQNDKHPVVCVNFHDARAYADWLSRKTGRHYRLPTEAEWEYAARAGTTTSFYTGNCINTNQANYDGKLTKFVDQSDYNNCGAKTGVYVKKTQPVGFYPPNPWGLYDMAGNADEWTCSVHKYSEYYNGNESICTNDFESSLAIRGGSWESHPVGMRSDLREDSISKSRKNHLGFRLAQDL